MSRDDVSEIELTHDQIRRLAWDAMIVACAAMLYVPVDQKRVWSAATRIMRKLKLGHMIPKHRGKKHKPVPR